MKSTNYEAPHYSIVSILCHFRFLLFKCSPEHPVLKHPPVYARHKTFMVMKIHAVVNSETLVSYNITTWCNKTEDHDINP